MKKIENIYKTLGIPVVVIVVLFTFMLLEGMKSLRIKELKINLQKIGSGGFTRSNMALLAKYNQFRQSGVSPSSGVNAELFEVELMGILANESRVDIEVHGGLTYYFETPILFVVNTLSYLFGSTPIKEFKNDQTLGMLTLGTFYERKRDYLNAIKIFSTSIEFFEEKPGKLGFVFLHRGFCFAMLGEVKKASQDYIAAIALRETHEEGAIAELLLEQLQQTKNKIAVIEKQKESVKKGLNYYQIMTYTKAIKTFDEMEKKKKVTNKLHFYRGRAYEEIGFLKNAVRDYQAVVKKYPNSSFAKKAYRRLYILGTYYEGNRVLTEKAKQKLSKLGDTSFIKKSENIENIVDINNIVKLPKTKSIGTAVDIVTKNTNATINNVQAKDDKQASTINDTELPSEELKDNNDFLSSLSAETLDEETDITVIQEDLKKLSGTLERTNQILKKVKKEKKIAEKRKAKAAKEKEAKEKEQAAKEAKAAKVKAKVAKAKAAKTKAQAVKEAKAKATKAAKTKAQAVKEAKAKAKVAKAKAKVAKAKAKAAKAKAKATKVKATKAAKVKATKAAKAKATKAAKAKATKAAKAKATKAAKAKAKATKETAKAAKAKATKAAKAKAKAAKAKAKATKAKAKAAKAKAKAAKAKAKAAKAKAKAAKAKAKAAKAKSAKKRTDKEILFDPQTSPTVRKKLIKKLYVKVSKIITVKGTFIGHILKENSSMVHMITPNGRVHIKVDEIGIRLRPTESKKLLR